ncbi:MAG: hypothetical protein JJU11_01880 [Candidatus Sumerlaeia bacterium]|nr:hypothetical protein [Candidatus Sumerlaeia bacterium]
MKDPTMLEILFGASGRWLIVREWARIRARSPVFGSRGDDATHSQAGQEIEPNHGDDCAVVPLNRHALAFGSQISLGSPSPLPANFMSSVKIP